MVGPHRARLLALFALAVSMRVFYILSTPPHAPIASVDAWGYHRLALNLEQRNGFSLDRHAPYLPTSVRTPVYPLFLLLVRRTAGPAPRSAAVAQALLEGGTTLLTAWLGTRLAGARAGRIAGLLYALNPAQVRFTAELVAETLLSAILLSALCALVIYLDHRRREGYGSWRAFGWLSASALLLGTAILCKPNVQFLPLAWAAVIAVRSARQRQWRRALVEPTLLLAAVALLLAPWYARNARVFGRPFLSTAFQGNVSRVSAPATLGWARGTYVIPWSAAWDALFAEIVTETAQRYGWHKAWDALTAREVYAHDRQVYETAQAALLAHPGAWLASHLSGMLRYLEPQTYRVLYARATGLEWPPDVLDDAVLHLARAIGRGQWEQASQIIAQERWQRLNATQRVLWWGMLVGQLIGAALTCRGMWALRRRGAHLALLALTIGYLLILPGPIAYERFRVPVTSLLVVLIGASVYRSRLEPRRPVPEHAEPRRRISRGDLAHH
ncbi:MAG: glycosyltransferase family 39 protein [Anaerolineae bacterium]|nr:glycosyltransferase family 39 protein [Anaerolineae bacterium]